MNKERLTAFIDAVLAIIMTILVLELEKPSPISFQGFWALRENFFAYALSFFWLGAMWVNLHNEWYRLKKIKRKTIWVALILLFFSSVFPYATSIVATNFQNSTAQIFYGTIVLLITFSNMLLYRSLENANKEDENFKKQMRTREKWIVYDILLKCIGLLCSVFIYPPAMSFAVLITLLVFVIPQQLKKNKKNQ